MPYILENMTQYDLTEDEAKFLEEHGFVVASSEFDDCYETTALVWNDFGIEGDRAFRLFDLLLERERSRYKA